MSDRTTLAFDTSAAHCAAAVVSGDRVLATRVEAMTKGQAERLMPLLEELLAEAGLGWDALDVIGVGTGPGNFTGTRIAVAAARGLALALGIPAEGVGAIEGHAAGRAVTVALPAPRGLVHLGHGAELRSQPGDAPLPDGWPTVLAGPAAAQVAADLGLRCAPEVPLAASIAQIAASRAAAGRPRPAPIYLRPADAAPARDAPPVIL
ncbi:tRNA (adenosine(37)-N6)-threonylcarbamoyltransferase complex dimerization subunit type 1 TsaB [Jannaschia sp. M317]|uniref:tRNA (adenosine(37)-N6)-threonylcarbamoyltransferase complex dimerization subunit type 1 TsaB n=1 Tax=Jannaschia sp. M317 TaxID=2867011 RepID=UPI0021A55E53|nr:tRNA (adenosine(37)-N6)-threonylcarbamoyltransferase complex dimerization subunit type 1 TsaB [Jannaschia sp. M317]UWQ18691.1 tRNA (adenosine(37)-N6)-threonylcarbamoyltransferase complex dimerization subunit type 1 TsaB [Jannaschia sp. M317]